MKIALIQMSSGTDKTKNLQKAIRFCREGLSKAAKFVLFPEYFYFRGSIKNAEQLKGLTENIHGSTVQAFAVLAKEHRAHILLGSIYEKSREQYKAHNTAVLISPDGKIAATYRKQHLFVARIGGKKVCEGKIFQPGHRLCLVRMGDFCAGIAVCFDVRFPEIFDQYYRKGANLFLVPSSFSYATGQAHWEPLLRARAIETFSYVLAPNQTGRDGQGIRSWGHSMVVDPWGKVLAEASSDREEIVYADIDISRIKTCRSQFPGYKSF